MTSLRRLPRADNADKPPINPEDAARKGFFKVVLKLLGYVLIHHLLNRN